jgi:hypothetical protein
MYRHPSLSTVNWFQKNRALSETALTELHRKVSVQKLKSATQYCSAVGFGYLQYISMKFSREVMPLVTSMPFLFNPVIIINNYTRLDFLSVNPTV